MDTRPEENDGRSKAVTTGGGWHGGIGQHDDVQSGVHARAEREPVREGGGGGFAASMPKERQENGVWAVTGRASGRAGSWSGGAPRRETGAGVGH
jgi:hypothetical protein